MEKLYFMFFFSRKIIKLLIASVFFFIIDINLTFFVSLQIEMDQMSASVSKSVKWRGIFKLSKLIYSENWNEMIGNEGKTSIFLK